MKRTIKPTTKLTLTTQTTRLLVSDLEIVTGGLRAITKKSCDYSCRTLCTEC